MAVMKILASLSLVACAIAAPPAWAANDGNPTDPSTSTAPAKHAHQRHAHHHKKHQKSGNGDNTQSSPQGSPSTGG